MKPRTPAARLKRPANVSMDELIRQKERDAWLERNRAAIEAYNRRIEREGAFSDGLRAF